MASCCQRAVGCEHLRGRRQLTMSLSSGSKSAPDAPIEAVVASLRDAGRLSEQSEDRLLGLIVRFLSFVERGYGAPLDEVEQEQVEAFVHAVSPDGHAPSVATSHLRRSAVRMLFRALREHGVVDHDPTLDVLLPPRTSLRARPLCDDEIALGRSFSFQTLRDSRQPAAWALAEATVRTSELSQVTVADLDLEAGTVHIAGSTKTQPRVGVLTRVGRRSAGSTGRVLRSGRARRNVVVYEGDGSLESRQASCCAGDLGHVAARRSRPGARCSAGLDCGVGRARRSSTRPARSRRLRRRSGCGVSIALRASSVGIGRTTDLSR